MDSTTGNLYPSVEDAKKAGVKAQDIVELFGEPEAVRSISDAVKAARRAENKRARQSRKRNRG